MKHKSLNFALCGLLAVGLLGLACIAQPGKVLREPGSQRGLVLTGGALFTSDPAQPQAEALIIRGGRITFVGTSAEALARKAPDDDHYELGGKRVLPGFVDGHTHPGMIGFLGDDSGESPVPQGSHDEILQWLREDAGWFWPPLIQAGEWPVSLYGAAGPRKEELDRVVRWRPVVLFDNSGHSQWLNSSALSFLGIDASTPDPAPGLSYFARDPSGEPTGWALEFALVPFFGDALLPAREEMRERMLGFVDFLSSRGVTTLLDAGNLIFHDEVYAILAALEDEGLLPLRYYGSVHITFPDQLDTAVSELKRLREQFGGERLRFETIKIHYDGVAEIRTAAVMAPYLGEGAGRGATLLTKERLRDFILELHEEGIDLHLHTSGDRAVRTALDAVEAAQAKVAGALRCQVSLAHVEMLAEDDIPRFAELGVVANFTPHWYGGYFKGAELTIGDRAARLHRVNTLLQSGAVVSFSSDVTGLPESYRASPFFGIQTAHNRQDPEGGAEAAVMPPVDERVDLEDLVRGYTLGSAIQMSLEHEVGSISVGKAADLMVLDRDLFRLDRYEIAKVKPHAVLLAGEVVSGSLGTPLR